MSLVYEFEGGGGTYIAQELAWSFPFDADGTVAEGSSIEGDVDGLGGLQ
jgi:hypothetical protein